MADIRSMAIPTFTNKTLEPKSAVLVTNAVIGQMHTDGTYKIANLEEADSVLRGTITNIIRRPLRGARVDVLKTREMEVSLVVEYVVEDLGTGGEIDGGTVTGKTNIFLDPNFQLTERQAVQAAAEQLAIELTSRLTEGF
ncbi:MAG: LPS assembly lipoprotein LptE [Verrucomicrobiales bacterium]